MKIRIFQGKEKSIPGMIHQIKDEAALWFLAGAKYLGSIVAAHSSE
jgi:hypothetical protein